MYAIPPNDNSFFFPDPYQSGTGDEVNYIAFGGDLSPKRLLVAYSRGIIPYYAFRHEPILWACPLERFVIFPSEIHISHSMRSLINKNVYRVTFNQNFEGVISNCAIVDQRIDDDMAWLGVDMIEAYYELHRMGYAHSVEVWCNDEIVGGLYGVSIGRCFCGESMFSLAPNASKFALIKLAQKMEKQGGLLIDCQFPTKHLISMGGRTISYASYISLIEKGL